MENVANMLKKIINPMFYEQNDDEEYIYNLSSTLLKHELLKHRIIYLDREIDQELSSRIISLLFLLDKESEEEPISFWITSIGGDVQGFFAIYDMMQKIQAPIKTICMGEAFSAAAFLLASGSSGERYAMPNSRVMIHQIQIDGISGSNAEIQIGTKEIKEVQYKISEIIARHTGHTISKIKRDIKLDRYMSAQEALNYGIVDKIIPVSKNIPELLKREVKK